MKRVALISLGCAKNLVDSEMIVGLLKDDGYVITSSPLSAEVIIINTCGFITSSKKESIETIFRMRELTNATIVVTGCLAERYGDVLKEELKNEVDLFIPIHDYPNFNQKFHKIERELTRRDGLDYMKRSIATKPYTCYLRIADGCSNCCTYCAIPLIRGPLNSRPFDSIIEEAKLLDSKGYKECVVIAQDTTKYGTDLKENRRIEDILKTLLKETDFKFIRLLYLYPDEISDELIDLFKNEPRLTPYFDIPIQHSESHILEKMNRRGDKAFLLSLFKKIRERVPNAILRTTIMLGFPYESEEDVDNLIEFMKEVRFDHLGAFTYSREENTKAYDYPQIKEKDKKRRYRKVMKAQASIAYKNHKSHIGEIMYGMVVGSQSGSYLLRSYWNAPDGIDGDIIFKSNVLLREGELVKVKITNASTYDLEGELYNKVD